MDWKTAFKKVQQGLYSPVYLCYGTEKYLQRQFIQQLTEKLLDPEHYEWARTVYDLNETPIGHVLEDAQTPPFLVAKKIIFAQNAMFCTGKDTSKVEHQMDSLLAYLENPVDSTILILSVHAEKLDARKKVVKQLKKMDVAVPFQALRTGELHTWLNNLVAKAGVTIDDQAIQRLTVLAGTDLETLQVEMDKLLLFVGKAGHITTDVVEELVSKNIEQNVFQMVEELVTMRVDRALDIYYDLLRQREEPVKIMLLIARQVRIMLQVKGLDRQGVASSGMATQLGLHPYAVKVSMDQSRRFGEKKLASWLGDLSELDYKMKTGQVDKVMGLEQFMLRMVGGRNEKTG